MFDFGHVHAENQQEIGALVESSIRSISRAFEVLELFDRARAPLAASDIARQLEIPLSSMMDIIKTLTALGYVTYDSRARTYFPSLRVAFLGRWIQRTIFGDDSVIAMLDEIREETHETVSISVLNDLDVQVIFVRLGPNAITLSLAQGQLIPIFDSSLGLALLSNWSDKEVGSFIKRYARRRGGLSRPADTLLEEVRKVRALGYAVPPAAGHFDGVGAVSVPVSLEYERTLVISVGGPAERIVGRQPEISKIIRRVAERYRH
jgi:IclR family KDG regulon transcriptional repressor